MRFDELYTRLSASISMEILDEVLMDIVAEFEDEMALLSTMSKEKFESSEHQYNILRLYDVLFRVGRELIEDKEYDMYFEIYNATLAEEDQAPIMFEPTINAWKKEKHLIPMGSLRKCSTVEEIEKWNDRKELNGHPRAISEKLDGISLEVLYQKGKFHKAITRGDGFEGDDITENARYFDGMVKDLCDPWDCAVRGEVMIKKEDLITINALLEKDGKQKLKNCRNGVAGLATSFKDRKEELLGLITFIAYEIKVFEIHGSGDNTL